jgi:6-pyruvoyltetrahydropterin/6-carboxytetrahydropterin synthase
LYENGTVAICVPGTDHVVGYKHDVTGADPSTPEFEVVEGITIVDFVPTSENLSKWAYEMVQAKMDGLGVNISRVDWWETPKSRSSYGLG